MAGTLLATPALFLHPARPTKTLMHTFALITELLGERVGERVGYRVRLDSCVGSSTRVEVVTTGILLQRLQSDPQLRGVGAVVLDEFHERGWQSDLVFSLCLACQRQGRADLRYAASARLSPTAFHFSLALYYDGHDIAL